MIKYQVYYGKDEKWHWRLIAANGEIVCWSEGYSSRQGAVNSANWVKQNGSNAPIV